ncbi:MAG: hypothetical protein J6X02_03070 [Bacilli bacterium]|nr:hypothetical protein [Bacilli bacterium]
MDDERKEVLDFLSGEYNSQFEFKTVGDVIWDAMHYYDVEINEDYNSYTIKDFITLCQIDCLLEKGLITEMDRNYLIRLFYQRKDLYAHIGKSSNGSHSISEKIGLIDKIFENYNIGKIDLSSMIYNNATVKEKIDLQNEIIKRKL